MKQRKVMFDDLHVAAVLGLLDHIYRVDASDVYEFTTGISADTWRDIALVEDLVEEYRGL
jgi:hypothetical protein